ncbi:hypothetical protein [Nocardia stercoris]|uniref:Uncharacterized protein n=1 Tax=Nocardia stercoris TaxID=2483361 RepID=A0A3M2LGL2_9NOCA|nr:hypothetical protein [Nocardia stercoris]RMI35095.1 hypothetical protein EBN03_01870 [Nocardia stercoris]
MRTQRPLVTVEERLAAAADLLDGEVTDAGGLWSRATVWILRLTVEQALDELWWQVAPDLARCSMRAQLLALAPYTGARLADRVSALWANLSRAGHHQDFELAPTAAELRGWYTETTELVAALARTT